MCLSADQPQRPFRHLGKRHVATLEHQRKRVLHVLVQVHQDYEVVGMVDVPGPQHAGELVEERRGGDLHLREIDEQIPLTVASALT